MPLILFGEAFSRKRSRYILVWLLLAAASSVCYSIGFHREQGLLEPDLFYSFRHLAEGTRFFLCLAGAPLAQGFPVPLVPWAEIIGGLLFCVLVALFIWAGRNHAELLPCL